jgi:acetamidase/formamidase
METKILIFATFLGAGALLFTIIPDEKYKCKPKDKITIESEKYLEELKKENELLVEKISKKNLNNVNNSTGHKEVWSSK